MNICFQKLVYYDRFSSSIKFWSSERNAENAMSELYLNEEKDYSEENKVAMKAFTPPFINHFSLSLKRKKCVTIRAMRKMTEVVIHRYSSK